MAPPEHQKHPEGLQNVTANALWAYQTFPNSAEVVLREASEESKSHEKNTHTKNRRFHATSDPKASKEGPQGDPEADRASKAAATSTEEASEWQDQRSQTAWETMEGPICLSAKATGATQMSWDEVSAPWDCIEIVFFAMVQRSKFRTLPPLHMPQSPPTGRRG